MTKEEKQEVLAELFDCDAGDLRPETALDEIGWDSMGMLSVIAMLKTRFDKKVSGADIRSFTTVQDIMDVMEK